MTKSNNNERATFRLPLNKVKFFKVKCFQQHLPCCLRHYRELKQRRRRRPGKRRLKMNLYFSYKFREWMDVSSLHNCIKIILLNM